MSAGGGTTARVVDHAGVDKAEVHAALLSALEKDRDTLVAAQRLSAEGVTHPDARSDGSKDMRATEASYIARGQAQRAEALEADVAKVRRMALRAFGEGDAVAVSALVTLLVGEDEERVVFIAPAGGGVRVTLDEVTVHVVTPISPMGRAIVGAQVGDVLELERGGGVTELSIEGIV